MLTFHAPFHKPLKNWKCDFQTTAASISLHCMLWSVTKQGAFQAYLSRGASHIQAQCPDNEWALRGLTAHLITNTSGQVGQNASAANSHLNQLEGWSERGMCCHIGHLNPPSIIHCFPMVTESPHHLLWFFRQKYRRAVGAEIQTCKEPKRPETTKQYSKRSKLQNEGKDWEIILQFFQSLQDLLALIYFWQEK